MKKPSLSFLRGTQITRKNLLWGLIAVSAGALLYLYGVLPLAEAKKKAGEEIVLNQRLLSKYAEVQLGRKGMEEDLERVEGESAVLLYYCRRLLYSTGEYGALLPTCTAHQTGGCDGTSGICNR